MELLKLTHLPLDVLRFAGKQLLGGGWADLPPLPQGPITRPVRASIQFLSTEIPDNIELGQE